MIIGNKEIFAFECKECEPPCQYLKYVFMWIGNHPIGYEKPYFSTYLMGVEEFYTTITENSLVFSEFSGKSDSELFEILCTTYRDDTNFGAITPEIIEDNFLFSNWDDALDGWTIFIIEKSEAYTFLWTPHVMSERAKNYSYTVEKREVVRVLEEFIKYSQQLLSHS